MIELGIARPEREARSSYTDMVVDALVMAASGSGTASPFGTAALEMAASRWARAMATAQASHSSINPTLLATIGRKLCTSGEVVYDLRVDPVRGLQFIPACDWTVYGGADRASWWYRLTLAGPSTTYTVERESAGVAHFMYSACARQPWRGIAPLGWASSTGALMGHVEGALGDEASGPRGSIVPLPEGLSLKQELKSGFASLKGKIAFPETTSGGAGDRGGAPQRDWRVERLGADPPAALVELRKDVEISVLSACGVPARRWPLESRTGPPCVRHFGNFLHLHNPKPLGKLIVAATFSEVLETPVSLTFDDLSAADIQSQGAGMAGSLSAVKPVDGRGRGKSRIVGFTE